MTGYPQEREAVPDLSPPMIGDDPADVVQTGQGIDTRLIDVLVVVAVVALPVAWWLSLQLFVETSVIDLTPPKVLAVLGLGLALLTRPWRFVSRADALSLGLFAAYAGWFIVASVLRATPSDVKLTVGYSLFLGAPMLAAYVAARLAPTRTSILLARTVLVALAVTIVFVVIERYTYVGLDQPDPLTALWSFFRPQNVMEDPILGTLAAQPLHFPSGDPAIPRVAALFAHVNYLAFFAVLAGILGAVLMLWGVRRRDRVMAVVGGIATAAASLITVWTYSRVGLIGLPIGLVAAVVVEVVGRGRPTILARWIALASPIVVAGLVLGVTLLVDQVGLRRLVPPVDPSTPGLSVGEQAAAIEVSAERSTALRLTMQRTAVAMILESPTSAIIGPGQRAFETAVHSPDSARYVPDAVGVRDPNSLWLSVAISGGLVGLILLAIALALVALRLWRVIRARTDTPTGLVVGWLAAWLATWVAMQFFGTYPFATAEAVILGTLVGIAIGLSSTGDRTQLR
jgi:O-antigen ligase